MKTATLIIAGCVYAHGMTPAEVAGKRIYYTGASEAALVRGIAVQGPRETFACAQCHGSEAEGSSEAGARIPAIQWKRLSGERGYDAAQVLRAVEHGVDPAGRELQTLMPRYRLSAVEREALLAYLKIAGTERDTDPGVSDTAIRVGAALPLSGELARTGEAMRRILSSTILRVNSRGGVYGRKLELVIEDSATGGVQRAVKALVESGDVFALVSNFQPGLATGVDDYLRAERVPSIGPLGDYTRGAAREHANVFRFLPAMADEADVLHRYLSTIANRRRALLIEIESPAEMEAASSFRTSSRAGALAMVSDVRYSRGRFPLEKIAAELRESHADCVVFLGAGEDLAKVMRIAGEGVTVVATAQAMATNADGLLSTYPGALPRDVDASVLEELAGGAMTHPLPQAFAFSSVALLVEAARLAGRKLTRPALMRALESVQDFTPGVLPAMNFAGGRRTGSTGAYVVRMESEGAGIQPVSEWLTPVAH